MIVKNEEKVLPRCLESVKGLVEEIIIVDTGSTDRTVEIAKQFGAKVYHFEWIHDFSAARNFSLQQATGDYILVLDADEYLEKNATLPEDLKLSADYYSVPIKNLMTDSVVVHMAVRLFKRSAGLTYRNKLHENLYVLEHEDLTNADATFTILHTGYLPDVVKSKNKKIRNLELVEQEVSENPSGYNLFNYGVSLMNTGQYEKALASFKKAYPLSVKYTFVRFLLLNMAQCLHYMKRYEESISIMQDAIAVHPGFTDYYYAMGIAYEELGYWKDAEEIYQTCLQLGDTRDDVSFEGAGSYQSVYRLAVLHKKQGRLEEAFDMAFQALQQKPDYRPALKFYLKTMFESGVSAEDMYQQLNLVVPLSDLSVLKTIIAVCYEIRHPLLDRYLQLFPDEVFSPEIRGVSRLYAQRYEDARDEWSKQETFSPDVLKDLMLTAFLLQDLSLFKRAEAFLNLRTKDKKFIGDLMKRQTPKQEPLTEDAADLLLHLAVQLLVLKEYDLFEWLSPYLTQMPVAFQCSMAKALDDAGHTQTALDLLLPLYGGTQPSVEVLLTLGDLCFRRHFSEDAEVLYQKAFQREATYANHERLARLYEQLGKTERLQEIKSAIARTFPLCKWVR
ncbi:hypothetical protein EL26_06305 [Tumebacillus flagellatus]|uniref:Glycosyltransferase 2-like domain-containing protein n=2 Tax=Tumebacillus flagellatus TaxID=1157490 RepID=A0A074ME22_9BACL|nr:hypothetical protein EL26_06305 [Tumebacillus flagellatus]